MPATPRSPEHLTLPDEHSDKWMSQGAEDLGLRGIVKDKELDLILAGFHPNTRFPLVPNDGGHGEANADSKCTTPQGHGP